MKALLSSPAPPSSMAFYRLQISFSFRFRHILLRLSRCRANAFRLIHTLPMSSRPIRKTFRKCASLLSPSPCFARRHRHHRLLLRHCNEDYTSFARNFSHQMLTIQDSCDAAVSRLRGELDFGSEGSETGRWLKEYCVAHLSSSSECQLVLEDAAAMDSNVAGHEINEKIDGFSSRFPARVSARPRDCSNGDATSDFNAAGRDINEEAGTLHFDELIKLRDCNAKFPQITSDAAAAAATGFNFAGNEIRFIENVRLKDCTEDVSQSSECVALENTGDADLNFAGDEINMKADAFIARFREHIRLERRNSDLRYLERLHRSVA